MDRVKIYLDSLYVIVVKTYSNSAVKYLHNLRGRPESNCSQNKISQYIKEKIIQK